jgi:colanic acid/amylovoran biosynthesis glycosyltransferase
LEEGRTSLTGPRVAYLLSQYPAASHTFVLREVRRLRELGFEIRVASIRAADRPFELLTAEEQEEQSVTFYIKPAGFRAALRANVRVLVRAPWAWMGALLYALRLGGVRYLLYFAEAAVFVDWMRRERLEQVHMHFTTTVGLISRRLANVRTSATIHGSDEFADPAGFHLARKVAAFDRVCAISEYGRSQLMRYSDKRYWNKLRVVRLGVDGRVFAPRPFRCNPEAFEILTAGRLAAVKGVDVLIGAMERLVAERINVRLRIAGDGEQRWRLEAEVERRGLGERVLFEGWRTPDELRALYAEADIFALASFAEGIPVVLMEAVAMEIACVATRITGIPELIRDEVDGLLVTPGNEEELARAMARLMHDSELRLSVGKSARRRVLEHFDLDRNVEMLGELLSEVGRREC